MTSEELRELAELVGDDDLAKRGRYEVAAYLRACADALEKGPVAWTWPNGELLSDDQTDPMWKTGDAVALYPVAMPAPTPPVQQEKGFRGWYCAHCRRGVDASEVTFHEQHTVCGRVITDDEPPVQQDDEALKQAAHALDEAAYCIADWGSYASDYFREKHDLDGDIKRTQDAAAHFRALLTKRGAA